MAGAIGKNAIAAAATTMIDSLTLSIDGLLESPVQGNTTLDFNGTQP
jgi:hypothetical protein